ncbi:MAG TPA: CoA transferase, partial [Mycobacterium sp.]|nr:CoA transferase [Mycobacterium sp.]
MNDTAGAWGRSGLAWLTGAPDGPPDFSRSGVLARAEAVAASIGERLGVRVEAATT